jgi:type VI secretion system ImpH/TssG family protein
MTTYYYRANASNQQSISFDRQQDDPFSAIVISLAGVSPNKIIHKKLKTITLSFARHLSFAVPNKSNLEDILRRLLKVPLTIRDFVQQTHDIPIDCRAVLGNPRTAKLGHNAQSGQEFQSRSQRFEIRIGPIDFSLYQTLISGFTGLDIITRIVKHYLDRPLQHNLAFRLNSSTVPPARLGFDWTDAGADAAQLGYTCWIGTFKQPQIQLIIHSSQLRHHHSTEA